MTNNLTGNAATVYVADYNTGRDLQTLLNTLTASLAQLAAAGATDSLAKQQALSDALANVSEPVIDAMNSYLEAGTLNGA